MNTTWMQVKKAHDRGSWNTIWCSFPTFEKIKAGLALPEATALPDMELYGMKVLLHEHLPGGVLFLVNDGSPLRTELFGMFNLEAK